MNPEQLQKGILLTKLLGRFHAVFTESMGRLTPECLFILVTLFSIELLVYGMIFVLRREIDWQALVWTAMRGAFFLWLIQGWPSLSSTIMESFMQAGGIAGGGVPGLQVTNPDRIALSGFLAMKDILAASAQVSLWDVSGSLAAALSGFVAVGAILIYWAIAIIVFVSLLEFYLCSVAAMFLLPWAMSRWTTWLTERALSHTAASAVRLFLVTLVLSAALPIILRTDPIVPAAPGLAGAALRGLDLITSAIMGLGSAATILILALWLNKICQGFVHGAPALAMQDVTSVVARSIAMQHQLARSIEQLTHRLSSGGGTSNGQTPAHIPGRRRL
jgi:type IV secretion system protein TrbL